MKRKSTKKAPGEYTQEERRPTNVVREHVRNTYIEPAVRRGDEYVAVRAGDVLRDLGLVNRSPLVCSALRSQAFLEENHLTITKEEGPKSRQSTTVKITYRLPKHDTKSDMLARWNAVRGIGKETYAALGGGEAFLRSEREAWGD